MPVFFGIAGLSADLTVLRDPNLLLLAGLLILIASVGKFGGAFLGAVLARLPHGEALALGCGMNARGSTEVIVATIGLSMGVLNQPLYTIIVTMAFVTTMAMPPMLRWALTRLPISEAESARLAREAIEAKGLIGTLERLLVAVDHSPNGRFAARLGGILSAWRRIPITVLEVAAPRPADAVPSHAAVAKDAAETATTVSEAAPATADVITRGHHATGDDTVVTEARKGYGLLLIGVDRTAIPSGGFYGEITRHAPAQRRGLPIRLRPVDDEVLRQAVALAELYQVETRTVVRQNMPVEAAIVDQLQKGKHDLVVLGVRARTGDTLFFGEIAAAVMERSPASVLLISG
jgi:nucleotide-binding universal stress UspA family protein